jgi:hypothetical protein
LELEERLLELQERAMVQQSIAARSKGGKSQTKTLDVPRSDLIRGGAIAVLILFFGILIITGTGADIIASIWPESTPTNTPTATPTNTPTPTSVPCRTLDSFEGGRELVWWTLESNIFTHIVTTTRSRFGEQALEVTFSKNKTYQFIGAEVPVEQRDFTSVNTLEVYVYGNVSLLLKLEDEELVSSDVSIQESTNTSDWSLFSYDIRPLRNKINLEQVKNLMFFPAPGNARASGVFYFDDLSICP